MLKCRATHAEFVVPYQKYVKSITNPVAIGTRFKMRFEMEDSPERRYCTSLLYRIAKTNCNEVVFIITQSHHSYRCSGVVTGICDLDPYRWPNSKWRCLMVWFFLKINFGLYSLYFFLNLHLYCFLLLMQCPTGEVG